MFDIHGPLPRIECVEMQLACLSSLIETMKRVALVCDLQAGEVWRTLADGAGAVIYEVSQRDSHG